MMSKLTETQVRFWDANGIAWIYDASTHKVYAEGTLEEDPQSGYYAYSLADALAVLTDYGYMEM